MASATNLLRFFFTPVDILEHVSCQRDRHTLDVRHLHTVSMIIPLAAGLDAGQLWPSSAVK